MQSIFKYLKKINWRFFLNLIWTLPKGGGATQEKYYMRRLQPEVQPLILLHVLYYYMRNF